MTIKGLFIDDERIPKDVTWIKYPDNVEWIIVRHYVDLKGMDVEIFDVISFDHDLQCFIDGEEITGYTILKEFCNSLEFKEIPKMFFHTQNPIGKENMTQYWSNYCKHKLVEYSHLWGLYEKH